MYCLLIPLSYLDMHYTGIAYNDTGMSWDDNGNEEA